LGVAGGGFGASRGFSDGRALVGGAAARVGDRSDRVPVQHLHDRRRVACRRVEDAPVDDDAVCA
jgi:hypothetical protein